MEEALAWWSNLTPHRKRYLAEYHYWSTPEGLNEESIKFIHNQEIYGY